MTKCRFAIGADAAAYHPRQMLLEGLADAVPHWTGQGNRVLVTSRPYGLNAAEVRRLGLRSVAIADLDGPLQELLVGRWFDALSPDADQGRRRPPRCGPTWPSVRRSRRWSPARCC